MSGKLYSLNTRCFATVIQSVSNNYAMHHNNLALAGKGEKMHKLLVTRPLVPMDADRALAFVHAMVKTIVSSYLAYAKGDTQSDIMAALLFGEGTKQTAGTDTWVNDFLTVDEIDGIYLDIDAHIGRILKQRETWAIVDVFDMGKSISIVVQEDLRIREWKQMKGYVGKFTPALELDLSEVISYLRRKTNQTLKPITVLHEGQEFKLPPGDRIDFKPILLEMLLSRYPFLRHDGQLYSSGGTAGAGSPKNVELLVAAGLTNNGEITTHVTDEQIRTVNNFLDRLVAPAVESFAMHRYVSKLDPLYTYTVDINTNEMLVITRQDEVVYHSNDNARIKELVESYLRGDWLPPKDREEAERYVQENQL